MENEMVCDRETIFSQKDVCEYVTDYCNENRFYEFYFCTLNSSFVLLVPISIVFVFTAFYFLASTAEEYLSPALSRISKKLNLSQTLAGVTLLAFGNGAPDVISSFTAGETIDGIPLVVGSIFGAGLFVTTIVFSRVILAGGDIQANKFVLLRDLGFYLIASLYVIFLGWVGYITVLSACGFFVIYLSFVITVVVLERNLSKQNIGTKEPLIRTISLERITIPNEGYPEQVNTESNLDDIPVTSKIIPVAHKFGSSDTDYVKQDHLEEQKENTNRGAPNSPVIERKTTTTSIRPDIDYATLVVKHKLKLTYFHSPELWQEMSTLEKIFDVYQYPFNFVRDLTIPASDAENWNKSLAYIHPFLSVWFLIWSLDILAHKFFDIYLAYALFPFQLFAIFLIWKYTHRSEMPKAELLFSFSAFVCSLVWISFVAKFLIDILGLLGLLSGLNKAYLGMTLLAWGNSAGDLFANAALAKMGLGIMALSGCFAGALFNLQIGFGSSILRATLAKEDHRIEFNIFDFSKEAQEQGGLIALIVLAVALGSLITSLVYSLFTKFKFYQGYARHLQVYYFVFFIAVSFYAIYLVINY